MRIFTAIPLPDEIKTKIGEIMKGRLPVSYVNTANLHITLNFFGELTDSAAEEVKQLFSEATRGRQRFPVDFDRLVQFRQQIHMTLKPNQPLAKLQSEMEKTFTGLGFSFQARPYYPHLKLANLHMDRIMNQQRKIEDFPHEELNRLSFTADKVVLFESRLLLHHAHHYPILEQKLA